MSKIVNNSPTLMKTLRAFVLSCALSLLALPVQAQEDTTDVAFHVQLADSVVVTASRMATPARETGRRVTVWTQQDIEQLPASSYDELLRTVAGVDVQSRGGFGVQSDLTMRGSTFNGVLVLLDGARINDPMTGHFLADLPVPLSEIARIEVLRGPASALYGPDALGGVVQIFTKTGLRDASPNDPGAAATLTAQGGQHNLYEADGAGRYITEHTSVSAAGALQGSDGEPIDGTGGAVRTDFARRVGTGAVRQEVGNATLHARVGVDDRDFSAYHFYTTLDSDTAREATATYWAQARLQGDSEGRTSWQAQLAAKQHEDRYRFNPGVPPNRHTSQLLLGQGSVNRDLGDIFTLGIGGQISWRSIDSNNLGTHDDRSAGTFVRLHGNLGPDWTAQASQRVDYDPVYGTEWTPQIYTAYQVTSFLSVRGGVGRSVRAPNYVERYYNTELESPPDGTLGTPSLNAERAWSYEAGLDISPRTGLKLHGTAFSRSTSNLIDYTRRSDSDFFRANNILNVDTRGLEAELTANRRLAPQTHLRLTGAYTFLDAELGDTDENLQYTYVLSSARHHVQSTLTLRLQNVTVGLQGLWKERMATPGPADRHYYVFNLTAGYTIPVSSTEVQLTGELRNAFDTQYSEVLDAPMPGRWWILGAEVQL